MEAIEQNTVSATEQVVDLDNLRTVSCGGSKKVLFIGNSITRHGPKPEIGWPYDWGMAASCPEKDFVHQTVAILKERGLCVDFAFANFSKWEVNYWDDTVLEECDKFLQYQPDMIVIRIGDNLWSRPVRPKLDEIPLYPHFKRMVESFAKCGAPIVLSDLFWPHESLDSVIHRVAEEGNYVLVPIGDLGQEDENKAIGMFEHSGVAAHPGDLGMYRIAERIATKILEIMEK